jgi:hypothetical protein
LIGCVSSRFQSAPHLTIAAARISAPIFLPESSAALAPLSSGASPGREAPSNTNLKLEIWLVMWNILRRTDRASDRKALAEETFLRLLRLEWKRANRSQRRFVLVLLEPGNQDVLSDLAMGKVLRVLPDATRETDVVGWYKDGSVIGIIFTEIGAVDDRTVCSVLLAKIAKVLHNTLSPLQVGQIRISFQLYPNSGAFDETLVAAGYRDPARNPRHEENSSNSQVFALKATTSS